MCQALCAPLSEEPTYECVGDCVYATMRRRRPPPLPPRHPFRYTTHILLLSLDSMVIFKQLFKWFFIKIYMNAHSNVCIVHSFSTLKPGVGWARLGGGGGARGAGGGAAREHSVTRHSSLGSLPRAATAAATNTLPKRQPFSVFR